MDSSPQPRKRSNSLPVPKIEVTSHNYDKPTAIINKLPNIIESKSENNEER